MGISQDQTTRSKETKIFRPWDHQPSDKSTQSKISSESQYITDEFWPAYGGEVPWSAYSTTPASKHRPKKFRCPHCHVGFTNNGQLKGHLRIHTGERPFKCESEGCGKSFTRNEELTRHKRIHSGVRPYPCSSCGKTFGRKDHLKKHIKTHLPQPQPLPLPPFLFYPYVFC